MNNQTALLPVFLAAIFLFLCGSCGQPAPTRSLFESISDEQPIQVTIETDLTAILSKNDEDDWQSMQLKFQKKEGEEICYKAKVKPRGVFRKATCDFPPLKLKVKKGDLKGQSLKDYRHLKLVTHCKEDYAYEQLVLKEYLAFKCYNLLTDKSFRVQLSNLKYVDSEHKIPDFERYGFIIENEDELADRLNGRLWNEEHGAPKSVDKAQLKVFALFQYMIGNTDWALTNQHNASLVQPLDSGLPGPFPVPYDFDFCGMVAAPYAIPHYSLPIKNVKERYMNWKGKQGEDFSETIALFKSKKADMIKLCNEFDLLKEAERKEVVAYLESFFLLLDSPGKLQ